MSTPTRRVITTKDKANADRLRKIWDKKKGPLKLTQVKIAMKLGISQPAFNQFLKAVVPLNTDMIFKISRILEVSPKDIDPLLEKIRPLFAVKEAHPVKVKLPVLGSTTGTTKMKSVNATVEKLDPETQYGAVIIDSTEYNEHLALNKGSTIILDLLKDPLVENEMVVVRMAMSENFLLCKVVNATKTKVSLTDFANLGIFTVELAEIGNIYAVHTLQRA